MVDFDHIAVTAAIARENHGARRGGMHHGAPGTGEIDARMEGIAAGEGIDAGAEAAGPFESWPLTGTVSGTWRMAPSNSSIWLSTAEAFR